MRLKRLKLTNFGIYKGENTFTFQYSSDRHVSIIIGKNGAGKTTFLNAFKVCLFGSMILGNRTITKTYISYVVDRLNKDALREALPRFRIEAEFISNLPSYDGVFSIERTWSLVDGFTEIVVMKKDGIALPDDEQNSFFNALYHAFPLELFDLFYLDGEKIDQLSVLNTNIYSLIESSINIDLFKRLKNDLLIYATKSVDDKKIQSMQNEIEMQSNFKIKKAGLIDQMTQQCRELNSHMEKKESEIQNLKDSLHIGSLSFDTYDLRKSEQDIEDLKKEIGYELTHRLPYSLVQDQLRILQKRIEDENIQNKNSIIRNALQSKELGAFLQSELKSTLNYPKVLSMVQEFYPVNNDDFIHHLSNDDYYSLKTMLDKILSYDPLKLNAKLKALAKLEKEHKTMAKQAFEIEVLKTSGQLDSLLSLQEGFASVKASYDHMQEQLMGEVREYEELTSRLKKLEDDLWTELKKSNISTVLDKLHYVLDSYIQEIKKQKIGLIETHTKVMFSKLIRKQGFIDDFQIKDNEIYLLDKNGNALNHMNLSAGEKHLFVLSLLYAVLQSSERKVPLIFDTLLGRLDEEHRNNVFKEFISSCPDQVIILATDSELSNIDTNHLKSITNVEYTIDFSKTEAQMTEVRM